MIARVLVRAAVALAALLASVALLVPVYPSFPSGTNLESSWITALNDALDQGLAFGTDLIFTFGPYAALYTTEYHPRADRLMLGSGLLLALSVTAALVLIAGRRPLLLFVTVGLLVTLTSRQKDALLLAYPLLVSLAVHRRFLDEATRFPRPQHAGPLVALVVLCLPLGLLPLIKGSLLVTALVFPLLCAAVLVSAAMPRHALLVLLVPPLSCLAFWILSAQPIGNLPLYFLNLVPIISGYSDAMSLIGPPSEVIVYLIAAAALLLTLWIIIRPLPSRLLLVLSFAITLYAGLKAGFVRHDGHALIAAALLAICALLAAGLSPRPPSLVLAVCLAAWLHITWQHNDPLLRRPHQAAIQPLALLVRGYQLRTEAAAALPTLYAAHRRALAQECPLPEIAGTADIYSHRQACLLFSPRTHTWTPRPVFQSYSAYTPGLAVLNAQHLRGGQAPATILFRVEPIDGRLPALEDGASWPLLLGGYDLTLLSPDLAYLKRRPDSIEGGSITDLPTARASAATDIPMPAGADVILASFDLPPTLLGRLASIALKLPLVWIHLTLSNGATATYRFVPGMARGSFVLSPLVTSTRDFALLAKQDHAFLRAHRVESIRITTSPLGQLLWSSHFTIRLGALSLRVHPETRRALLTGNAPAVTPVVEAAPEPRDCDGAIDQVNGQSPVPADLRIGSVLAISGWSAVSAKDGVLPDEVLVVLRSAGGDARYLPTRRMLRPDVRDHFGQPGLLRSGFAAFTDTSTLSGAYTLHLAQRFRHALIQCRPIHTLVTDR